VPNYEVKPTHYPITHKIYGSTCYKIRTSLFVSAIHSSSLFLLKFIPAHPPHAFHSLHIPLHCSIDSACAHKSYHILVIMSSTRPKQPASVLFTPFELRQYQRWCSQHLGHNYMYISTIPIPNAYEYALFQAWRAKDHIRVLLEEDLDAPNDSEVQPGPAQNDCVVASICKHPLHSATTKDGREYCPLCVFELHNALITALWNNWRDIGGPWRSAGDRYRKEYNDTSHAYHSAKVALANAVHDIEDMAALEETWHGDDHVASKYGAVKALEMYRKSITFPTTSGVAPQTPKSTPNRRRLVEKKSIMYSPDTPENTNHRPQAYWARNLTSHDPNSPHACPSADGYWDTSHYNDWRFVVSQCRILLCYFPHDDEYVEMEYRDLNAGADRGLENPAVVHLITLLEQHIAQQNTTLQQHWYQCLRCTGDVFLVWKDEGYEGLFSTFEKVESLVGTHVEEYAWGVGDIDDEEWAERTGVRVEEGEDGNEEPYDQMSLASDGSDPNGSEDDDEGEGVKSAVRIGMEEDAD
jgi:hypothetical protein